MTDRPHHIVADASGRSAIAASHQPNSLDRLADGLEAKARLCDLVEGIADALPNPPSLVCLRTAAMLRRDLPVYHADADLWLFPHLRLRHSETQWISRILNQFEADHVHFETLIDEIAELLERIGTGRARRSELYTAGYALRSFFENVRRHISWEKTIILPLARESLTEDDMERIASGIEQNRKGTLPDAILRSVRRAK